MIFLVWFSVSIFILFFLFAFTVLVISSSRQSKRAKLRNLLALSIIFIATTAIILYNFLGAVLAEIENRDLYVDRGLPEAASFPQFNLSVSIPPIFTMTNPAIIITCYNRPDHLNRTLHNLLKVKHIDHYPIFISQDGQEPETFQVAQNYVKQYPNIHYILNKRVTKYTKQPSYVYIAAHTFNALTRVFNEGYTHTIFLDDDIIVSPDFLYYFESTAHLLDQDPTLFCISSWNEYGFKDYLSGMDPALLFRTERFPSYGWLIKREFFDRIKDDWPTHHYDHYLQFNNFGECVCPYVNRNYNIGDNGATFSKKFYLDYIAKLSYFNSFVDFGDVSYLLHDNYERHLQSMANNAPIISITQAKAILHYRTLDVNFEGNPHPPAPIGGSAVYLLPFHMSQFVSISAALNLHVPSFRCYHNFTTILKPKRNVTILLADAKLSPYIPVREVYVIPESLKYVAGEKGASCTETCVFCWYEM